MRQRKNHEHSQQNIIICQFQGQAISCVCQLLDPHCAKLFKERENSVQRRRLQYPNNLYIHPMSKEVKKTCRVRLFITGRGAINSLKFSLRVSCDTTMLFTCSFFLSLSLGCKDSRKGIKRRWFTRKVCTAIFVWQSASTESWRGKINSQ